MGIILNQYLLTEEVGSGNKRLINIGHIIYAEPINSGANTRVFISHEAQNLNPPFLLEKDKNNDDIILNLQTVGAIERKSSSRTEWYYPDEKFEIRLSVSQAWDAINATSATTAWDITSPFQEVIDTLNRANRWPVNALYP